VSRKIAITVGLPVEVIRAIADAQRAFSIQSGLPESAFSRADIIEAALRHFLNERGVAVGTEKGIWKTQKSAKGRKGEP
jgi:hypothetical protein